MYIIKMEKSLDIDSSLCNNVIMNNNTYQKKSRQGITGRKSVVVQSLALPTYHRGLAMNSFSRSGNTLVMEEEQAQCVKCQTKLLGGEYDVCRTCLNDIIDSIGSSDVTVEEIIGSYK